MHLIICNERLLFRFGVDRVLLLLAQHLKAAGWHITFIAQRADHDVLRRISDDIHTPPPAPGAYIELDRLTAEWLREQRHRLLPSGNAASGTVALIGGWPFYSSIPVLRQWGVPVVALDCGGVPVDGMEGAAMAVQERLRALRREFLPEARVVTPISRFIERTQSRPDAGPDVEIQTIHLGSDHLAADEQGVLWQSGEGLQGQTLWPQDAAPRIVNLGRWEVGNYKNSEALYPIARQILARHPGARFGVLARGEDLQVPADLRDSILPLGHPSDAELARVMAEADLGLSVSLWEGFNLPLAEMQQLGKPVLVFDIGAHPEVAAHPWQLCRDPEEMTDKALRLLAGDWLDDATWQAAVSRFREHFTWAATTQAYAELLARLGPQYDPVWPQLIVDASACLRDPANTGVARVVRSLSRKLQDFGQPLFVAWDEQLQDYVLPTEAEYQNLAAYGGPNPSPRHYLLPRSHPARRQRLAAAVGQRLRGGWLLQGEIVFERQGPQRRAAARELGLKVAAIFYDAIPVTHPQWVADAAIRENHAAYMRGLAECDRVLPISPDAAHQLEAYWQRSNVAPRAVVQTCWIPGELTAAPRASRLPELPAPGEPLRLLCVSTLEPRKNHRTLLAAVQTLARQYPQLDWRLDLIGNRYAGGDDIAAAVQDAAAADPRIVWHGVVDDATLNRHYAQAHITIYPSLVEGYGMPIVESLWHARPSICHAGGVMAELAADGGCRTVDMHDPDALAAAIHALASDPQAYRALVEQAVGRHILGWRGYARALLQQLAGHAARPQARSLPRHWQHWLLPETLPALDAPEQLALATLLHARPAQCVVLVGEQPDWLLELCGARVAQSWQLLDADSPALLDRHAAVSRIQAPLVDGLSLLLDELARQAVVPDLILLSAAAAAGEAGQLASRHTGGLLLLPVAAAAEAGAALGLPAEPAIALAHWQGYALPLTATGHESQP